MRSRRAITIAVAAGCATFTWLSAFAAASPEGGDIEEFTRNIHWLGHDSFRIEAGGLVIYIDPWGIPEGPEADIILITHDHRDHCSPEDVAKVRGKETEVVTVEAAASKLSPPVTVVEPGDALTVKGLRVKAVPAYNVDKFRSPGVPFHPKEAGYVGYLITVEGVTIYHPGDTDPIPEMKEIKTDIALLPVSGIYVMTAEEAVKAADQIKPKLAIPMHVGKGIGSLEDAERFKKAASVPVKILPME